MALKIDEVHVPGYETVVCGDDAAAGLHAIIAIHSTKLGPSCGGIRLLPYTNQEEALTDVLRLSKGMSYKSALAGIGFGGGKSVIICDPNQKSEKLFHAFGEFVETLGGRYIAAKDMNIVSSDLAMVKKKTKHVLGIEGEAGSSGDPSPFTARGILAAMQATAETLWGKKSLKGLKIAIQGVGHVGYGVAETAKQEGAELLVADTNAAAVKRAQTNLGATPISLEGILEADCDILSPCARGAVLNSRTIPHLRCKAIVGCANNQLETQADGLMLFEREILYAPDYAVNSGGIINIFVEHQGYDEKKAIRMTEKIFDTTKEIFRRAKAEGRPPFFVADKMAKERLG